MSLFDIDEPLMLLWSVEEPVAALPVGVIGVLPPVVPLLVAPLVVLLPVVPMVEERVAPVAVPLGRVEPLLMLEPLVEPLFGPAAVELLLGAPEAPPPVPVLPALVPLLLPALVPEPPLLPDCARAPPQATAAAAERARILMVCLMHYS